MKITSAKRGKEWPKVGTHNGITVRFYQTEQVRNGTTYQSFMVRYTLLGESKMKGFADWSEAVTFAEETANKIADGEQRALQLSNADADTYLRAVDSLKDT